MFIRTLLALIVFFGAAATHAADLSVSEGYVRATPPGLSSAAAYLTLENGGAGHVFLTHVISDCANQVMIHQNILEGDMMRMRHVAQLKIDAGSQVVFEPGGYHLMMTGLSRSLNEGDRVLLKLVFQHEYVLEVSLPVIGIGAGMSMKDQYE